MKALIVFGDFGIFQSEVGEIRRAADAHQNAIVKLFARLLVDFHGHFDLFAGGGHLQHFGVDADFFEGLLRGAHHRAGEVGIDAGENRRQGFQHHDVAAEGSVDRAELHADIAAADHQQVTAECRESPKPRWMS